MQEIKILLQLGAVVGFEYMQPMEVELDKA
jgi:hypothetical protein